MILCEKCDQFLFPECDEDGIWSAGCKSPKVVSVFMNFFRKKKCRYYQKISYDKLLKETKIVLSRLTSYTFHYRDKRYPGHVSPFNLNRFKTNLQDYIEFKEFLFNELKVPETEVMRSK